MKGMDSIRSSYLFPTGKRSYTRKEEKKKKKRGLIKVSMFTTITLLFKFEERGGRKEEKEGKVGKKRGT